jgi:hypothetical protein
MVFQSSSLTSGLLMPAHTSSSGPRATF